MLSDVWISVNELFCDNITNFSVAYDISDIVECTERTLYITVP